MAAISARHRSDSRRRWVSLALDLAVASPVGFKLCFLPRVILPPAHDHVTVLRVQFDDPRLAVGALARDQRRTRPAEGIEDRIARLAAVPERALDKFHRLHGRVL